MIWIKEYSVGIESMDNHHKMLFEIINELHEAMAERKGKTVLSEVIKKLEDYTIYHFTEEEALLASVNYQELQKHKNEHKVFIDKLFSIEEKISSGYVATVPTETSVFLTNWLREHIKVEDQKYASALASKQ